MISYTPSAGFSVCFTRTVPLCHQQAFDTEKGKGNPLLCYKKEEYLWQKGMGKRMANGFSGTPDAKLSAQTLRVCKIHIVEKAGKDHKTMCA